MQVLLVEDDVKLVRALRRGLELEGCCVDVAGTGPDGLSRATGGSYDAVVLDLGLPGLDGQAVCEAMREQDCWTPVLMLTARSDVADRIRGLDGGADDYVVKPVDLGELSARLRVLARRGPVSRSDGLTVGALRIDVTTRRVRLRDREVELTPRELDVLTVLARNSRRLVPRDALLRAVWQDGYEGSPNVADVYVGYLRKKLDLLTDDPVIRTLRGRGFVLDPP